jgi:hypothetical protein
VAEYLAGDVIGVGDNAVEHRVGGSVGACISDGHPQWENEVVDDGRLTLVDLVKVAQVRIDD